MTPSRTRLHARRLQRGVHLLGAGTLALPKLFGASLGVALVAAPAASAFLGRHSIPRSPKNLEIGARFLFKLLPT